MSTDSLSKALAIRAKANKKFGFIECPKCRAKQIEKTISCRSCGYQVTVPNIKVQKIREGIV